ncbi:Beta-ketoacyl synthase, N-terminal domain [Succinivibrio dextrinosolvens]|uniref:beta-ketoacyl synthase chain length factor n=1 Tax=Succinivibrio dextrinosolvens TaxID=83771 RepID=UPI0008E305E5|nr:beta-ketoacyl synthase chain length factor [Succinivibrio dextrinosolvens]SFS75455.1 Beta-ketoacyl synthase, N-terminal domain [Succinivibrio dextrinosolvens]
MNFSLSIADYRIKAFDIVTNEQFSEVINGTRSLDKESKPPKAERIPMMTARRLSIGCRMAVDVGTLLLEQHPDIDAVIYSSRSGEIEHNFKILDDVTSGNECSPTDFSMSVHNCGVGNFTILNKAKIPSTSISSGKDTFMQALIEAYAMLKTGYRKILLVDYEVTIPEFYTGYLREYTPNFPYAIGLVLESGDMLNISSINTGKAAAARGNTNSDNTEATRSLDSTSNSVSSSNRTSCSYSASNNSKDSNEFPQVIEFLKNYVKKIPAYSLEGQSCNWRIKLQETV